LPVVNDMYLTLLLKKAYSLEKLVVYDQNKSIRPGS